MSLEHLEDIDEPCGVAPRHHPGPHQADRLEHLDVVGFGQPRQSLKHVQHARLPALAQCERLEHSAVQRRGCGSADVVIVHPPKEVGERVEDHRPCIRLREASDGRRQTSCRVGIQDVARVESGGAYHPLPGCITSRAMAAIAPEMLHQLLDALGDQLGFTGYPVHIVVIGEVGWQGSARMHARPVTSTSWRSTATGGL